MCTFKTGYAGICGKHSATDRCPKHFGKKDKEQRQKIGKYRGKSNWAVNEGLFVKVK